MKYNYRFLISALALIGLLSANAHEQKHLQFNPYVNQDTTQCPLCHDVISVHDAHACVDQPPNHSYAPHFFPTPIMNPNHSLYPFHPDTRNPHNTPQLSIAPYIAPHYPSNQHPVQPTVTNLNIPRSTSADFDDFIITCEFCGVEIESYNTHICPVQNYPDASHNTPNYPNTPPTNFNPPTYTFFHQQPTEYFTTDPQHHQPIEESGAYACSNQNNLQALNSSKGINPNEYLCITCEFCGLEIESFYTHSCPDHASTYEPNYPNTPQTANPTHARDLFHHQPTEHFATCPQCHQHVKESDAHACSNQMPNHDDTFPQKKRRKKETDNCSVITLEFSENKDTNTQNILNMLSEQKQLAGIPYNNPLTAIEFTTLTQHQNKNIIYKIIRKNAIPFYQNTKCTLPGCPDKDKTFNKPQDFLNHVILKHTNLEFQCPIESCKTPKLFSPNSMQQHYLNSHQINNKLSTFYWLLQKTPLILLQFSPDTHNNTEQILNILSQQKELAGIPHNNPLTKEEFTTLTEHQNTFIIYNCIRENAIPFYQNTKCTLPGCPEKDKTFKKPKDFLNHFMPNHTNLQFQCPIETCKKTFSTYHSIQTHSIKSSHIPTEISLSYWLLQKKEETPRLELSSDTHNNTEQILDMLSKQKHLAGISHNNPLTPEEFKQLTQHQKKSIIYNCIITHITPFYENRKCILPRCPDKDKIFRDSENFLIHFIQTHTNLVFKCPITSCSSIYSRVDYANKHFTQQHKKNAGNPIYICYWWLQHKQ